MLLQASANSTNATGVRRLLQTDNSTDGGDNSTADGGDNSTADGGDNSTADGGDNSNSTTNETGTEEEPPE